MKSVAALILMASSANAFSPSISGRTCVSLQAKHANNKAAKKANHDRPRKSRPSDIHRKPVVYDEIIKPAEYTILEDDAPASSSGTAGQEKIFKAKLGTSLGMMFQKDEQTGYTHTGFIAKRSGSPQSTFNPVDWSKVPQGRDVEEAEEDALAWLEKTNHEDAMAWIQSKIDKIENDSPGAGKDDDGSVLSLEELGLPEDAELIEIVDDKELVFE